MATQAELFKKFLKREEDQENLKKPEIEASNRVAGKNLNKFLADKRQFVKEKHKLEGKYGTLTNQQAKEIISYQESKHAERLPAFQKKIKRFNKIRRYGVTRSGTVNRGVERVFTRFRPKGIKKLRKEIKRLKLQRQFNKLRFQATPSLKENIKMQVLRQMQLEQQQRRAKELLQKAREEIFYDSVFKVGDMQAPLMEKELMQPNGEFALSDRTIFNLDKEVSLFGNALNQSSGQHHQVSKEALHYASLQHLNPITDIERRINAFNVSLL